MRATCLAVCLMLSLSGAIGAAQSVRDEDLIRAAERDDVESVKQLIQAGANVNVTNRYGVSPLSLACLNGSAAVVEQLLKAGADANTTQRGAETVLMTAARTGVTDVLTLLLAHGADVNARERTRGQTALMWAAAENHAA